MLTNCVCDTKRTTKLALKFSEIFAVNTTSTKLTARVGSAMWAENGQTLGTGSELQFGDDGQPR